MIREIVYWGGGGGNTCRRTLSFSKDDGQARDGGAGARSGGGTGLLALHREGRRAAGHAGEDSGAAPAADDRADAYAGHGPVRAGWHGYQLQYASGEPGSGGLSVATRPRPRPAACICMRRWP